MTFNFKNFLATLSMASCFLLTQCTAKKDVSDTLRFRLPGEPPSLDWTLATDNVSKEVLINFQEGLLEHDSKNNLLPALAEKYTASDDLKLFTFQLRKNVQWSDGVSLTAQHFVDAWERVLNPKNAVEYSYFLFDVDGAEDYQNGKLADFTKVGVKAVDESTLVVRLNKPLAFFPHLATFWITFPIRKDIIEKFGDRWTNPENIVTLGAYRLKIWEHDSKIILEKNPTYYNPSALEGGFSKIEFRIIKENTTAISLFTSQELDIVRDLPPLQLPALSQKPEFLKSPYLRGYYYGFNLKEPKVADLRVRRAMAKAINRTELEKILHGAVQATSVWIPQGLTGFSNESGLNFDLEGAQKLWKELGDKAPKTLEIFFNQDEMNKLVAENIQQQWKKNLSIEVTLQSQEWKVYLSTIKAKQVPPVFRLGWGADYPDPDTFLNLFTCKSGNNHTAFCNSKYDGLIKKGAAQKEGPARDAIYQEAEKILLQEEVAIVPFFTQYNLHMVAPRIKNFQPSSIGDFYLKNVKNGQAKEDVKK